MKVSKLIKMLEKPKEENGDVIVEFFDFDFMVFHTVGNAEYIEDKDIFRLQDIKE